MFLSLILMYRMNRYDQNSTTKSYSLINNIIFVYLNIFIIFRMQEKEMKIWMKMNNSC